MMLLYKTHGRSWKYILALVVSFIAILFIISNSTTVLRLVYPLKYEAYVYKYSVQNKLDPYLVFAVIKAESGFDPAALSHKNARGLMQITEKTGSWAARSLKLEQYTMENLYDPEVNIRIGCWYMGRLMKEFNNDVELMIAAYNGGSGNVSDWLKDRNFSQTGLSLEKIPFRETENYVKKVKNYYIIYKRLYEKPS